MLAALFSPRPPEFLVLNEPESSLHPDLLAPLARLIAGAGQNSQIVIVTHARELAIELQAESDCQLINLTKDLGESRVDGQGQLDKPPWIWPKR